MTSKQARLQAETALKSMKETTHPTEIQRKTQANEQSRVQAETLRLAQDIDDNILNENHNFANMLDAYFNISSRDGLFTFSKAMSPSFGGRSQIMLVKDLVCSLKLVMD